ncbi:GNAT family N-acetyltransferase [Kordiimonas gwangyangensis]|uniref:GNAT family N-acetyltransferase n=1 Tax=Kordiimonas gwangyangensis TaxID=288022 RepID=UPI00037D0C25|nr:GNAT family N-acetyltransferase [Kordiimonas gwangyangensis]
MKNILKKIADVLIGPYEIYAIFRSGQTDELPPGVREVTAAEILASPYETVRAISHYDAPDALFFGAFENELLASACCVWHGATYTRLRGFIDLPADAAKLVQINTAEEMQGKHLARKLIKGATFLLKRKGFKHVYARVWRGHIGSEKAFKYAGWQKAYTILKGTIWRSPFRISF